MKRYEWHVYPSATWRFGTWYLLPLLRVEFDGTPWCAFSLDIGWLCWNLHFVLVERYP